MDFSDDAPDGDAAGGTTDAFPAPAEASPHDVERYNHEFLESNPDVAVDASGPQSSATMDTPFAKQAELQGDPNWKAEFPWLYDPSKGRRWDFDPVELRVLSQENAWVQMMVQSITKEIAETSWTITTADDARETDKRLSKTPGARTPIQKDLPDATAESIYEDLRRPVPHLDWSDAVEMWMRDYLEVGSMVASKVFDERFYDEDDELTTDAAELDPLALQPTAPEVWTKDYNDRSGVPNGYWQFARRSTPGGAAQSSRGVGDPTHFDMDEVLWSDNAPATNRGYGDPPTLFVSEMLQSVDLAVDQEQNYLSRGSIPSGAWVFEEWDREQVLEWKSNNAENIKGKPHKSLMFAGRGGDVKFEPMSMNFKELEFTERMRWYARVIAAAFQVPTAVVGIEPEKVNYNTFQGERENFETNTLGPYLQDFERWLNHGYIDTHYDGYRFEFTPGMSETTKQMRSDRIRQEWNANLRTRDTAARELGIDLPEDAEDGFKAEVVDETPAEEQGIMASVAKADPTRANHQVDPGEGIGTCENTGKTFPCETMGDLAGDCPHCGDPISYIDAEDLNDSAEKNRDTDTAKQTFDDYPDAAVENARMALDAREDTGDPNDCGTDTGWARANQLDNREALSEDTVRRMAAFRRHQDNAEMSDDEGRADCGWMMWKAWGGEEGVAWAERKVDQLDDADTAEASVSKDEPLRNTDDWAMFDVQPGEIDVLAEDLAADFEDLFAEVLSDDQIQQAIDSMAADETDKSVTAVARRLRELLAETDLAESIQTRLEDASVREALEAIRNASAEADEDVDVDEQAIREQLRDRTQRFADNIAEDMAESIRETVGDGFAEGKNSREIAQDIAAQGDLEAGWGGAERIARQELQIASGRAREAVAADLGKVEVWMTAGDDRVRDAHAQMDGLWKRPGESWTVEYERGTKEESVPGSSEPGIGCRCVTRLVDREDVDAADHGGTGSL
jgi:hypothetical protein